jgi:hypothetical protein
MSTQVFRQTPAVIEGIGAAYADALHSAGVTTLAEMLRRSPEHVQLRVPGSSVRQVEGWFAAAWLLRVDGIDPDIAEALVNAGLTTANALADAGLQTLERAMSTAVEKNKLKTAPSLYKLAEFQRSAFHMHSTGSLYGTATNFKTGEALEGVVISCLNRRTETGADGYFELHGIASGKTSVTIAHAMRGESTYRFFAKTDHLAGPLKVKVAGNRAGKTYKPVREVDGAFISPGRGKSVRLFTRTLEEMPNGTYLRVREISDSGSVRLLHLFKTRVGREIQGDVVIIEKTGLPNGAKVGQIVQYQDGALQLTDLVLRDVALQKLQSTFGNVKLKTVSRRDPKRGW